MFWYIVPNILLFLLMLLSIAPVLECVFNKGCAIGNKVRITGFFVNFAFYTSIALLLSLFFIHALDVFYISNVYMNSNLSKPLLYKIAGAWGNHEGSMILWVTIMIFAAKIFFVFYKFDDELKYTVPVMQLGITFPFLAFSFFVSNPFDLLSSMPHDGLGFNPVLQDIALSVHPPILYSGYAGSSIVYSFVLSNLLLKKTLVDHYFKTLKILNLILLLFMTAGIFLGSWWAYRELGWGGYWFWDPVENISLIPWLLLIAILHTIIITMKHKKFSIFINILVVKLYMSCILGTFIVRSGLLSSVHSFTEDSSRGIILLFIVLANVILLSYVLYKSAEIKYAIYSDIKLYAISKSSLMILGIVLFVSLAFILFLSVIYPIIYEYIFDFNVAINNDVFNSIFTKSSIILIILMFISPYMAWDTVKKIVFYKMHIISLILSIPLTYVYFFDLSYDIILLAYFTISFLILLLIEILKIIFNSKGVEWKYFSVLCSHGGIIIVTMGILASSCFDRSFVSQMFPEDIKNIMNYEIKFNQILNSDGNNYNGIKGEVFYNA